MKLTNKDKVRIFDFIMSLGTIEFLYYTLMIELFNYKPKSLKRKIGKFIDERRKSKK